MEEPETRLGDGEMKLSEIYLKAAESRDLNHSVTVGCCWHIWTAEGCPEDPSGGDPYKSEAQVYFRTLFRGWRCHVYWWPLGHEYRNERVIALLLAAAIARSEGR